MCAGGLKGLLSLVPAVAFGFLRESFTIREKPERSCEYQQDPTSENCWLCWRMMLLGLRRVPSLRRKTQQTRTTDPPFLAVFSFGTSATSILSTWFTHVHTSRICFILPSRMKAVNKPASWTKTTRLVNSICPSSESQRLPLSGLLYLG